MSVCRIYMTSYAQITNQPCLRRSGFLMEKERRSGGSGEFGLELLEIVGCLAFFFSSHLFSFFSFSSLDGGGGYGGCSFGGCSAAFISSTLFSSEKMSVASLPSWKLVIAYTSRQG